MDDVAYPADIDAEGLALLARFACAALSGMMANAGPTDGSDVSWDVAPAEEIAKRAFGIGVAMLAEYRKATPELNPGVH